MGRRGQIGRQLMMWRGNGPTRNCPGCSVEPGDQEQKKLKTCKWKDCWGSAVGMRYSARRSRRTTGGSRDKDDGTSAIGYAAAGRQSVVNISEGD